MSYQVLTNGAISQSEAEELGKWLALYEVQVSGLQVWQIDVDGKRHRDNALMRTIKDTARELGAGLALAPIAVPLIGMIPPLAALAALSNLFAPVTMPALKAVEHKLNKKIPDADGKEIAWTELEFDLAGVSAKRRRWSEYLLSIYAHKHQWQLTGLVHPEQLAAGSRAADYPVPWSRSGRQPARRSAKVAARPASHKSPPRRSWRDWLDAL